jgi:hypothetical protein
VPRQNIIVARKRAVFNHLDRLRSCCASRKYNPPALSILPGLVAQIIEQSWRAPNMRNFLAKRFLFPRWEEMIAVAVSIAEKMERELET